MTASLTFKNVCDFVKRDNRDLLGDANLLSTAVMLLSAVAIGPGSAGVAGLLGTLSDTLSVKDQVATVGKRLLEAVSSKKDTTTLQQAQRMEVAYYLLTYTAFFEALEQLLPTFSQSVDLNANEQHWLVCGARAVANKEQQSNVIQSRRSTKSVVHPFSEDLVQMPHPVGGFEAQKKQLLQLYQELTNQFLLFIKSLAVWEQADERQQTEVREALKNLPELAFEAFLSQYYVLASKFDDFYVWSNLLEHERTREQLQNLSDEVRPYYDLLQASQASIDLGFHDLAEAVRLIAEQIEIKRVNDVLSALENTYMSFINNPVIDDKSSEDDTLTLTFPRRNEIFVPQAYKAVRYTKGQQLENESAWRGSAIQERQDLGLFLIKYLKSSHSFETPLVILGHPGSGKSLLTGMLAAQLHTYTCIRVELRNIDADQPIHRQIEEQILKTTNGRQIEWPTIVDYTKERPVLVILDGYDELLQASGQVYANFLRDVAEFQKRELTMRNEPVRVIVTSRITLIDKAYIPEDATILRLLDFDEPRRDKWISVWNNANQQLFTRRGIEPFFVPKDKKLTELGSVDISAIAGTVVV